MTNKEKFQEAYKRHLAAVRAEFPDVYLWPASDTDMVAQRMFAAMDRGSFSKEGYAFKRTCKELKIKPTYQEINAFYRG